MRSGGRRTAVAACVAFLALAGCGADHAGGPGAAPAGSEDDATAEGLAARAREVPGVVDATVTYLAPDGSTHEELPGSADRIDWTVRVDITHTGTGWSWATETVGALVASVPQAIPPGLEVWAHPETVAEVAALVFPAPTDADPVRDAYLLGATPGVVRAVSDGNDADVTVRAASDLARVADVARAHGMRVSRISTADGRESIDVASGPDRPATTVVDLPWPDDPAAPDCPAEALWPEVAGHDAATGHRVLFVAATNISAGPCAVEGYPDLSFGALDGARLDVTVVPGGAFGVSDPGAQRVVIPPGARVMAVAGWDAMPTAGSPDIAAEVILSVLPAWAPRKLALTSLVIPGEDFAVTTLDIVHGGEVTITAWAPEGTAW